MNTFNVYAFTIIFFSINKYSGPYIVPVVMNRSPKGMVSFQCIFFFNENNITFRISSKVQAWYLHISEVCCTFRHPVVSQTYHMWLHIQGCQKRFRAGEANRAKGSSRAPNHAKGASRAANRVKGASRAAGVNRGKSAKQAFCHILLFFFLFLLILA